MKAKNVIKIVLLFVLAISFNTANAQHIKHHKAKRNDPHYRYAKMPHWGYAYKAVPKGSYIYPYAGVRYNYYNGVYYKPVGKTYVIASPPIGMKVRSIPTGHVHFVLNGRTYFYYYGTFYVKSVSDSEYIAIEPPVGARVNALPDGYQKVSIDGKTYYEFEGTYYKAIIDNQGEIGYEVVGKK